MSSSTTSTESGDVIKDDTRNGSDVLWRGDSEDSTDDGAGDDNDDSDDSNSSQLSSDDNITVSPDLLPPLFFNNLIISALISQDIPTFLCSTISRAV